MKCKNCKQIFNPVKDGQKYCFERECLNVWIKTEKEKNSEGKQIGGFIIGKTKGKGTFGKVK